MICNDSELKYRGDLLLYDSLSLYGEYVMTAELAIDERLLTYEALKARARQDRDGWPQDFSLRAHRALSWLQRAERETGDDDVRFVLLWIALNAAYADLDAESFNEAGRFAGFARDLVRLDRDRRLQRALRARFPREVRCIFTSRYLFPPFWEHQMSGKAADWRLLLERERAKAQENLARGATAEVLRPLFGRLKVLRNQLVHGGATWNGRVNRDQVRDGARVLGWLAPTILDLMMRHPDEDWGRPSFPVVREM